MARVTIEEALHELQDATKDLDEKRKTASSYRNQETDAMNRVNTLQKMLDSAIEELHGGAPQGSDWHNVQEIEAKAFNIRVKEESEDDN